MGVDIDQSRSNDLAARVDRLGGVARDVGLDRDDLAAGNRNVADRIEPSRGVDDAPALDKEIVGRRASFWDVGEQRSRTVHTNWRRFIMVDSPPIAAPPSGRNRGEYVLFAATLSPELMRVPPAAPRFLDRSIAETTVTL